MSDLDWDLALARHQMFKDDIILRCGKHTDQVGQLKTTACTLSGGMQSNPELLPMREWPFEGVTVFGRGNLRWHCSAVHINSLYDIFWENNSYR